MSTRPNILLLMTDQHRADLTNQHRTAGSGLDLDTMPRLDQVAAAGAAFGRAYTSYPACVPARTSLLTGRFPTAHHVRQNSNAEHAYYSEDLLDVLRAAGYSLHFAGKPHMHRTEQDFDTYHGPFMHDRGPAVTESEVAFDQWLHDLDHGVADEPTPYPVEAQLPYRIVDGAIEALQVTTEDDPFFLWVSFPEPHNPYQVPEPYFSLYAEEDVPERLAGPEAIPGLGWRYRWLHELTTAKRPAYDDAWRRYRANYLGMLRLIDDQIARLLDQLGDRLDDTIVVFVSDHGDYVGEYGLQRKGAGMSDFLMRIPFVVSGPGVTAGPRDELVSMVDLFPTLCELVGAEIPAGVQGRSLAPLLAGEAGPDVEFGSIYAELGYGGVSYDESDRPPLHFPYQGRNYDELNSVTQSGGERMVVSGNHKLIVDDRGQHRLYDLSADPAELVDLADDPAHHAVHDALQATLLRWLIRVADDLPAGAYTPKTVKHNWRWA
ncbi:sulfatase-like hydrolase/transferase [Kribbella italica]|uniref:Arylsulfatase A-like enzyme n=1 Tax=Kribbella italica TaxID=1540520 RepID=A0A7W9J275_9ACTN|nr:sulfatase-like hydrolase/transferase [Kribbella italica]MBB5833755.1 arylsulfatase A-like enzyme [Kribbella italica]